MPVAAAMPGVAEVPTIPPATTTNRSPLLPYYRQRPCKTARVRSDRCPRSKKRLFSRSCEPTIIERQPKASIATLSAATRCLGKLLKSYIYEWTARYPREKQLNELPWASIGDVHAEAARFLDPLLTGTASGAWEPAGRAWGGARTG